MSTKNARDHFSKKTAGFLSALALALGVAYLLVGCASKGAWHKEGATREEAFQARAECRVMAGQSAPGMSSRDFVIQDRSMDQYAQTFGDCMNGKGYMWEKDREPKW